METTYQYECLECGWRSMSIKRPYRLICPDCKRIVTELPFNIHNPMSNTPQSKMETHR